MRPKICCQALEFVLLLLLLPFVSQSQGQNKVRPQFEYFFSPDGGITGVAHTILQDRHGFIWAGTTSGLYRYDGYSFRHYRPDPDDPNSLSNKSISFLYEDSEGWLWIGTLNLNFGEPGKLNRLDRATGKFERFEHDPNDPGSISSDAVTYIFEDSKKNLWICTEGGGINRYDRQTGRFEAFRFGTDEPDSEKANSIYFVVEDSHGILWMNTDGAGLNSLDPSTGKWKRYQHDPVDPQSLSNNTVSAILEDSRQELWIGTENGLNRLKNRQTGSFERFYHGSNDPQSLSHSKVSHIYEDARKDLWIGTAFGLNRRNRSTGTFQRFLQEPKDENKVCGVEIIPNSMLEDSKGNLWARTFSSIAVFDRDKEMFHCFPYEYRMLFGRRRSPTLLDKSGNIWLGSNQEYSLARMHVVPAAIQFIKPDPDDPNSLMFSGGLSCFIEDSHGVIWFGSKAGLDRIDRARGKFEHFKPDPDDPQSITVSNIRCILEDSEGYIWIGGAGLTLDRLDRQTGKLSKRFHFNWQDSTTILIKDIVSILEGPEGGLWFGGGLGISKRDKSTGLFQRFMPFPEGENLLADNFVESMIMDSEGYIWAGTSYKGLCRLDPATGQFEYFQHDPEDANSLCHNSVSALLEDSQKNLWVGTPVGLNRLGRDRRQITRYFVKHGLPGIEIKGILEDDHGNLWISTDNGISKFDPGSNHFQNFDAQDGLQWHYFTKGAHFKSPRTGELFFGGKNGFNIFHPDSLKADSSVLPVVLTSFTHYHRESGQPIVDDFISEKGKITLSHYDNVISFEFAALNFRNTAKTKYKYQLAGFSDQWYELGNKREVTFTSLPPGNYTLRVMAANSYGVWSDTPAELAIEALPPWWWSFWTKLSYLLLGAGLLYSLYRYQLNRKVALAEARNLKEMDSMKTRFYTNITHEFRTPLTVIQGLSDQLAEKAADLPKEKIRDNAMIVKRNSAQLLTMIEEMLDLRRLESGSLPVHLVKGDVLQYFRYLSESFHSYATDKGVGLHFMSELETIIIDYDPDKLLHIVSNLLSNAIKFTPEGGNVYFSVEGSGLRVEGDGRVGPQLVLKVKDTGIGISEESLPFIFDRFYQAPPSPAEGREKRGTVRAGTGIGLALTRELVKLMKGTIEVKSKLEKGTIFIVRLPITREATEAAAAPAGLKDQLLGFMAPESLEARKRDLSHADGAELPLALVIEDNPDVIRYLSSCLEGAYNVVTALNGKTGVDTALDLIPDIIISDVMMPEKDGYEVCEILKNDERTSHIPIVLLTAKADSQSRLEGLRKGADAYLAKPFSREELEVRLEQLLELRRKLQERYSSLGEGQVERELATIEDAFLQKVRAVILSHISDPEFGQPELSKAIGVSRSQLFRKLKALTGKSTSLVVRSIRLQKAKELLQTTNLNVSEVAYDVGFKDLSYFSKCFIEEFGEQPRAVKR